MTLEEMYKRVPKVKPARRKKPSDEEHQLQVMCVKWFRYRFPRLRKNLFAVPNGGRRDAITGARMKAEGVLSGVSDLLLLKSNRFYHGLCIEMKTAKGVQSDSQKDWEYHISQHGYKYVVCRSVGDFRREVESYLSEV